jgi:hypothetical protein
LLSLDVLEQGVGNRDSTETRSSKYIQVGVTIVVVITMDDVEPTGSVLQSGGSGNLSKRETRFTPIES